MESEKELEIIASILQDEQVQELGLEIEVIWSALKYAQTTPDATIADCMNYGYNEWIK